MTFPIKIKFRLDAAARRSRRCCLIFGRDNEGGRTKFLAPVGPLTVPPMEFVYALSGLFAGLFLGAVAVVTALTYTPYGASLFDTAITALTGVTLQLGNLLFISALTALAFEGLAMGGIRYPAVVPAAFAYVLTHVTVYYSCIRITDLQSEPLDPDVIIKHNPFRALVLGVPGSLLLIRVRSPTRRN